MWVPLGRTPGGEKGGTMKLVKVLLIVVVVLVLLAVAGGIAAFAYVDSWAKKGIERGGTYALGVETTVGSADVGLLGGTFGLSDLKVANVAGYQAPHFLTLGDGSVAVSLGTLREPTIVLPHLKLDTVDVRLEKKDGAANYSVILDNLKKVGSDKPVPAGEEKKYIVDDLSIGHITVHVDLIGSAGAPGAIGEAIGSLTKVTVPIDEVKLQNVGKAEGGLTMGQLTSVIVRAVLVAAAEQGKGLIPADILGDLEGRLAALGDLSKLDLKVIGDVKGKVEELGKAAEDVQKKVQDAAKEGEKALDEAKKRLEGLIPKKREENK